jgi:uncharacterized protein (TIGR00369 family)
MSMMTIAAVQAQLDASPMTAFLGIRILDTDPAMCSARFEMAMRPELERLPGSGQFHGGAIASFADTAGDFAVAVLVGGPVPTMNLHVDFLRPATAGRLYAVAVVRKLGRTVAIVDVDVLDDTSKLIAVGRATYVAAVG